MQTLASTRTVPAVSSTDRAAHGASRYHAQRIQPRFAASRRGARALGPARAVASAKASPGELRLPLSHVRSEEEMFTILRAGVAQGKLPASILNRASELMESYTASMKAGGISDPSAYTVKIMAEHFGLSMLQMAHRHKFDSAHKRVLEPYDYYSFGQRYIQGLIDMQHSCLGHVDRFAEIQAQLDRGENVVLLANHQTEADPAVWALLLESRFPKLATEVAYVAGDRVITDPLCIPFSLGRNLYCVHSKKHLNDVPELKAEKAATNRQTLRVMARDLAAGGVLIWVAPSGGRDRTVCPSTGETLPDPFDPAVVELMRALLAKAGRPGHLWPLAMYSARVMPPPTTIEKDIGERRVVGFAGCGLSPGPELDVATLVPPHVTDRAQRQQLLSDAAFESISHEYVRLLKAVHGQLSGAEAEAYTQPKLES